MLGAIDLSRRFCFRSRGYSVLPGRCFTRARVRSALKAHGRHYYGYTLNGPFTAQVGSCGRYGYYYRSYRVY